MFVFFRRTVEKGGVSGRKVAEKWQTIGRTAAERWPRSIGRNVAEQWQNTVAEPAEQRQKSGRIVAEHSGRTG